MIISEVAALAGLPTKTVRYYDDIGLVPSERGVNGYRRYTMVHAHRLAFVSRLRAIGFSIDECRGLLALFGERRCATGEVQRAAAAHLERIDRKMRELEEMRRTVARLAETAPGDQRPGSPALADLADASAAATGAARRPAVQARRLSRNACAAS